MLSLSNSSPGAAALLSSNTQKCVGTDRIKHVKNKTYSCCRNATVGEANVETSVVIAYLADFHKYPFHSPEGSMVLTTAIEQDEEGAAFFG